MNNFFEKYNFPDEKGHFEKYGGKYVPETLIPVLKELESEYIKARKDTSFKNGLEDLLKNYSG